MLCARIVSVECFQRSVVIARLVEFEGHNGGVLGVVKSRAAGVIARKKCIGGKVFGACIAYGEVQLCMRRERGLNILEE